MNFNLRKKMFILAFWISSENPDLFYSILFQNARHIYKKYLIVKTIFKTCTESVKCTGNVNGAKNYRGKGGKGNSMAFFREGVDDYPSCTEYFKSLSWLILESFFLNVKNLRTLI